MPPGTVWGSLRAGVRAGRDSLLAHGGQICPSKRRRPVPTNSARPVLPVLVATRVAQVKFYNSLKLKAVDVEWWGIFLRAGSCKKASHECSLASGRIISPWTSMLVFGREYLAFRNWNTAISCGSETDELFREFRSLLEVYYRILIVLRT